MAEMLLNVKSAPLTADSALQSIASLPVIVNEIDVVEDVAVVRAKVTVGADVSIDIVID